MYFNIADYTFSIENETPVSSAATPIYDQFITNTSTYKIDATWQVKFQNFVASNDLHELNNSAKNTWISYLNNSGYFFIAKISEKI